jgi:hypothetical protein
VVGLFDLDIGQHQRQLFDHFVRIDDAPRLGKQRSRLDVGGQHFAVAIDNVGPRRGDPARRPRGRLGILEAEIDQPAGNGRVDAEEHRHGHDDSGPCPPAGRFACAVDNDRGG